MNPYTPYCRKCDSMALKLLSAQYMQPPNLNTFIWPFFLFAVDKVTIFSKENEINAPSCGHGITKLASTFHTPPTHIKSSKMLKLSRTTMACAPVIRARIITTIQKIPDPLVLAHCVDHSSDLATTTTTELWNSKDKVCILYS